VAADKTEKPTPKRLEDARKKGQVAKSNDLNGAVVLTTAAVLMMFVGPYTCNTLMGLMRYTFQQTLIQSLTHDGFLQLLNSATQSIIFIILPFFIGVACLAILSNIIQIRPLFAIEAIAPKLDKVNPIQGFKRLFSLRSIVETAKGLIKMTIIGLGGTFIILSHKHELMALNQVTIPVAMDSIMGVIGTLAIYACAIFLVLGIVDFLYQKYELNKQLKMSMQEIKDERKNMEGDPTIKRRIREVGIQLSRKRQLADVKTADVVVTNPTHFAVAIKYDPDVGPAPLVIAKGVDHFAMKIREVAKDSGIPIRENPPLARSLHALVEVGHMIPPELFVAVAEVLAFVFSKKKGRKLG